MPNAGQYTYPQSWLMCQHHALRSEQDLLGCQMQRSPTALIPGCSALAKPGPAYRYLALYHGAQVHTMPLIHQIRLQRLTFCDVGVWNTAW